MLHEIINSINTISVNLQQANTIILVIVVIVAGMGFKGVWDALSGK